MTTQPVFIPVGALADGFAPDSHILANDTTLQERRFTLFDSEGGQWQLAFASHNLLHWQRPSGQDGHSPCRVTSLRPQLYLVDWLPEGLPCHSATAVLDLASQHFTLVEGTLPGETATRLDPFRRVQQGLPLTAVQTAFYHGCIDRPVDVADELHAPTRELIGLRNLYRYSPTECYEHIYLNEHFYAWQCLQGVEQGLADVDRCHYIRLAESLYLFVWCEKIVPTLGVILIDLQQGKTDGKILGYQGNDFGPLSNFAVGAIARVLNHTQHPL